MPRQEQRQAMKIVPPGKKKCVWMEAGVVSYKLCDNNYDCPTCVYDHAMQVKAERHKSLVLEHALAPSPDVFTTTWVGKMMAQPASRRKCRYMITGEVDSKLCPNAYECGACSFDQMMQQRIEAEPLPVHTQAVAAEIQLADGYYYHEGHTWARPEYGGRVRVGLDDFAQKLLGKISRIQLPQMGQEMGQGEVGLRIGSNGEAIAILSPVDGIVTRVNERMVDHPELINESPYNEGWLFLVEPTKLRKNLKGLHFGKEANGFVQEEWERLFAMANDDLRLAADGAASVDDLSREMARGKWLEMVKTFLRSA